MTIMRLNVAIVFDQIVFLFRLVYQVLVACWRDDKPFRFDFHFLLNHVLLLLNLLFLAFGC